MMNNDRVNMAHAFSSMVSGKYLECMKNDLDCFCLVKSEASRASELSILNDDECKRILSVVERDFKLRQQEYERLELVERDRIFGQEISFVHCRRIKKTIQQENERVEYLASSKEFNLERCIRCFKPFRFLFNPRESCSECTLFVCQHCASYNKENKSWACKSCLKLK